MRVLFVIALCLFASAIKAEDSKFIEFFDVQEDDTWNVIGRLPKDPKEGKPICFAATYHKDGTEIHITKELDKESVFHIWIQNPDWQLTEGVDDKDKVRLNFYFKNNRILQSSLHVWGILNKNTVMIDISEQQKQFFANTFSGGAYLKLIMPTAANLSFPVSPAILRGLGRCFDAYKAAIKMQKESTPRSQAPATKGDRYDGAAPPKAKGEKI